MKRRNFIFILATLILIAWFAYGIIIEDYYCKNVARDLTQNKDRTKPVDLSKEERKQLKPFTSMYPDTLEQVKCEDQFFPGPRYWR